MSNNYIVINGKKSDMSVKMDSTIEKVKEIIKNNIEDALFGIFDCRNTVGDPMETIYDNNGIRIEI